MKNIFLTFAAFISMLCTLSAQVYDRALSFGFYSQPKTLHPLGDGRWLSLVYGEPVPGILYTDTVVALVFNSESLILQKIYLPLPLSEIHTINSATPLSDGGFAVSVANELCDAGFNKNTVLVYNQDGTLRWSRQTSDTEYQPRLLRLTPDGNLIGLNYHQLAKYSASTGAVLWKTTLEPQDPLMEIYDFALAPGAEHLVATGFPDLQSWRNLGTADSPDYRLIISKKISPKAYFNKLVGGLSGNVYTFDASSGRVFLLDWLSLDYTLLTTLPYWIFDMTVAPDGLYFVASEPVDSLSHVLRTGLDGKQLTSLSVSRWETGLAVAQQNDGLAIAGISGSGPRWAGAGGLAYNARHLWLQTRPLSGGSAQEPANVALTAVEQNEPLQTALVPATPWHPDYYQFSGGKFRVQLRNTGQTMVDQADVQIAFDWDYSGGVCLERPAKQRRYTGLGLEPGASVWLDFGNISAAGQLNAPTQLCFWTAAPNERPDADRGDDVFCHTAILSDEEPVIGQFSISPNPADTRCRLVLSAQKALVARVYDIAGRLIQEMDIPAGENTQIDLQTGDWPDGMYFLQMENRSEKIVVQHR
ncbi:MAG: T9SS type A sorting domain-containing protein [Thermoanaerobaculia bacterium]|nr:T9SS type A sorting domain-containing protein [Thermoanaerobaculia bacterium]